MKKSKLLAAAMAALAIGSTVVGCDDDPAKEAEKEMYAAYGPAPFPVTDIFEYNPEEDEPVDVYGPPVSEDIEEPDLEEEYEPEKDEMVCVYGPPSYFENNGDDN